MLQNNLHSQQLTHEIRLIGGFFVDLFVNLFYITTMRGQLTPQIKEASKTFFGEEITVRELRLLPYIQYTMMNDQKIEPSRINAEERAILAKWRSKGWLEGGMTGLAISKEFWDTMNELLWMGYVAYEE